MISSNRWNNPLDIFADHGASGTIITGRRDASLGLYIRDGYRVLGEVWIEDLDPNSILIYV